MEILSEFNCTTIIWVKVLRLSHTEVSSMINGPHFWRTLKDRRWLLIAETRRRGRLKNSRRWPLHLTLPTDTAHVLFDWRHRTDGVALDSFALLGRRANGRWNRFFAVRRLGDTNVSTGFSVLETARYKFRWRLRCCWAKVLKSRLWLHCIQRQLDAGQTLLCPRNYAIFRSQSTVIVR